AADAGRRDFTMNAIYADLFGRLTDPTGGVADALARRVRFIGDAHERIREDYLRILRFFRFHAAFGSGNPDPAGLAACCELAFGLERLSRERVGQEMRKLLVAPGAAATVSLMADVGILGHVLPGFTDPAAFERLVDIAAREGVRLDPALALVVLAVSRGDAAEVAAIGERLRLSRAETARAAQVAELAWTLRPDPDQTAVKLAVYRQGNDAVTAALLAAAAKAGTAIPPHLALARDWLAPRFPVTGKQLLADGYPPGPALGRRLAELEAAWIAETFGKDGQD
ncbi:MAG TPA: CCA tRNA nucleotidyltransferase, partial [Methylomirabilota bacterium]|nr:CCA tRNA nucleotidyltransferase [Methylomirabilota bacterium]